MIRDDGTVELDRELLQKIRDEAEEQASVFGTNQQWKRALENLAHAADVLDAYQGRSQIK